MQAKTYTVREYHDGTLTDTWRSLTWDQADTLMVHIGEHGGQSDWAEEILSCPEDCDAGCYDEENFAHAHGETLS